jgi:predicted MPP superfamily phosphohydrolase
MRMIIFFAIVILVFGSLGYYLFSRISSTFSPPFFSSRAFLVLFIFLISSFFLGKILESFSMNILSDTLIRIGAISIGFSFYAVLAFAFFDLIGLLNKIIPFYPEFIKNNPAQIKNILGVTFGIFIIVLGSFGIWNSFQPRIKNLEVNIQKNTPGLDELNIVAISDIHLGTMVNKSKMRKLIDEVNKLDPDLVIIAGDIVDDNAKAVKHYGLLEYFNELKPKYGVHGIMGNHEYIGRSYDELAYYENNNLNMIIDSAELIDDKFYIVGRDDLQAKAFFNRDRKDMQTLFEDIDLSKPVILMDHQPYNLEESAKAGVDFHFSGHTHHGQFWPLNYITGAMFEQDWGYLKKGDTHYYVSCGYGTALVPMRIASHPEIVNLKMIFGK